MTDMRSAAFRSRPVKILSTSVGAVAGLLWSGLAAVAFTWATPAQACSYSQVPEPVGHASAEFFAKRMAPAATFVDVAVAEDTQAAFGARPGPAVFSTSFRVVFRLKGQSPDRFSLYVWALKPNDQIPEAKHFVDEQGRVSPYPYPGETNLDHPLISSSCDPGMLGVRAGQAYVIFREADGRLLRAVPMHDGRSEAAFPIMPVALDAPFGWLQAAGLATAGRHEPPPGRAPSSELMAVRFKSALSARDAERWATTAGVRPVAVSVARGKLIEEARVPLEHATPTLVAHAVIISSEDRSRYLRGLAAQFLDETDESLQGDMLLQQNAKLLFESAAVEPDANVPARVVAMEVTGKADALARLTRDPQVAEVRSGYVVRGRTGVDPLVERAAPIRPYVGTSERETARSLRARLTALAQGRPLPAPELIPPEPEPDPYSYTGCIRIGQAEALALNHPLFDRFAEFSLYAPNGTDCTKTAAALTCRLPPGSAVRLDAGGRIGGFRVGPQPATFELQAGTIRCAREGEP